MSLQLRCFGEGGTGLIAVCDVCGEMVTNAAEANLCWVPIEWTEGEVYAFKIACKDQCTRRLDRLEGQQFTQELDLAIGFLMNNSRVNFKKMREKMAMLYEMGLLGERRLQ